MNTATDPLCADHPDLRPVPFMAIAIEHYANLHKETEQCAERAAQPHEGNDAKDTPETLSLF